MFLRGARYAATPPRVLRLAAARVFHDGAAMRPRGDQLSTGARITGTFEIEPGREVFGELTLEEDRTRLFLRDDDFFHTLALPDGYLKGQGHDLSCLSLFDCITMSGPGSGSTGKQSY